MIERHRKAFNIVLALLVSIAAWFFVVYNYDQMTNVKYTDVPITYTGLDTLANRGYAVAQANHDTINVTLEQKRIDTASITKYDITVTADVSALSTGDNVVTLRVTGPEGTQVRDTSLKTVTIDIASAASEEREISVEYAEGTAEENDVPVVENMSMTTATIIATEDRLADIDKVVAIVDPADVTKNFKSMTLGLSVLDKDGNKLNNVIVRPETVSFRVAAGRIKEVPLTISVKDESDDTYERSAEVPETVVIIGRESVIDGITAINAGEIDISYYYVDSEIPLELELPEGVYLADESEWPVLKLTVKEKTEEESADNNTGE